MEGNESTARLWKSKQAYGLAMICLISGVVIGYLARTPFQSSAVKPQETGSTVAHASNVKIPADQLQPGADKETGLLLDQLRKSPNDASLLAELGKVYYQKRQFAMAAMYYEDSVRIKPDAAVFVNLGGTYHFDGEEEKAVSAWNQALRLDPNNPDALFNIGLVKLRSQGDPKAAIISWQKLLKTNPNHPKRAQVEALIAQAKRQSAVPVAGNE